MHRGLAISVVVPCYNEEAGIEYVMGNMPPCVDEVIVVDNNSTDATAEVARRLGAAVIFEPTAGYGRAYGAGLQAARGDIIATLDGDGTYPAGGIPEVVDYLLGNRLDFVSACRFPLQGQHVMPLPNLLGNKLLTVIANALFSSALDDSLSGMWVFRRHCLDKIKPTSSGMAFSAEIKIEALLHPEIALGEYHIPYFERIGESKLVPWRDGLEILLLLLRTRLKGP